MGGLPDLQQLASKKKGAVRQKDKCTKGKTPRPFLEEGQGDNGEKEWCGYELIPFSLFLDSTEALK